MTIDGHVLVPHLENFYLDVIRTDHVGDPFCVLIRWRLSGPVCETDLVIDIGKERKREVVFLRECRLLVDRVEATPENFGIE